MKYYKLYKTSESEDGEITSELIGAITSDNFVKYKKRNNIIINCSDTEAEYICYDGSLYHSSILKNPTNTEYEYQECDISLIEKDEYDSICTAVALGEKLKDEEPEKMEQIENELSENSGDGEESSSPSPEDKLIKVTELYVNKLNEIEKFINTHDWVEKESVEESTDTTSTDS